MTSSLPPHGGQQHGDRINCTHCGKEMPDAMRFCSNCWNDLAIKDTISQAKQMVASGTEAAPDDKSKQIAAAQQVLNAINSRINEIQKELDDAGT